MSEVPPFRVEELLYALQNNPDAFEELSRRMTSTVLYQWERLGRVVFRRTLDGDIKAWVREPRHMSLTNPSPSEWGIEDTCDRIILTTEALVQSIDAQLFDKGYFCMPLRHPVPQCTPEMVSAALGHMRQDQFTQVSLDRQIDRMMHNRINPPSRSEAVRDTFEGFRNTGKTTRVLVEAVAHLINGQHVVVVAHDRQRVRHTQQMAVDMLNQLNLQGDRLVFTKKTSAPWLSSSVIEVRTPEEHFNRRRRDEPWPVFARVRGKVLFDH